MSFQVTLDLDWGLLKKQKLALVAACHKDSTLDGILELVDYIQDCAAEEGEPVQWLSEEYDDA